MCSYAVMMIVIFSCNSTLLFSFFSIKRYAFATLIPKLRALIQSACLASAISWLAFVVAIFTGHEDSDHKGQPKHDTCKACWVNKSI